MAPPEIEHITDIVVGGLEELEKTALKRLDARPARFLSLIHARGLTLMVLKRILRMC